jgi:signal transduction histidine kinase
MSALCFLLFRSIISEPRVLKNRVHESGQKRFKEIEAPADKLASIRPLLAGVVHQINNPLSNIRLASEVVLEEMDEVVTEDKAFKEFHKQKLTSIISEVDRAREILRELNQLSSRKILKRDSLNLTDIINRAIQTLRPHIPPEVDLRTDLDDHIRISANNHMITTGVVNLISFAVQSIEGKGAVVVTAQEAKDGMVDLAVTDTGRSIPEQDIGRVFEPYFTSKESARKTNLGLFIAYDIVKRHNGKMWAESTPGKGLTLRVKLPTKECFQ